MKIENIIEDIKKDITDLKDKVEERFKIENPNLNFSVSLPDIEELTTIKSIALLIDEDNTTYYLCVHIHTHNGNRVFENPSKEIMNDPPVPDFVRHLYQDRFVNLLREIIKKKKNKIKSLIKRGNLYYDSGHHFNTA